MSMRNSIVAAVAGLTLAAAASHAAACGFCDEDKIAAVYDHKAVASAAARHHQVAYFSIEGNLGAGASARRALEAMAESVKGVDKGSARASVESASMSVAIDTVNSHYAEVERSLKAKFAGKGLSLAKLTVERKKGK